MKAHIIIIALLSTFLFGAWASETGFTYSTVIPFVLSISIAAYAGLTSHQRGGPITFDKLNQF